jgi:D-aspartate ligase
MKRDHRTGRHYIIEPNIGRPTGRSAIAERAGVDLLYTQYCDVTGRPLSENREQRYVGATWVDLRRDVLSAAYHRRRGELSVAEWVRSLRGPKAHAVLSLSDPLPFVLEIAQSSGRASRRLLRRIRSRLAVR